MTQLALNLNVAHPSWHECLQQALKEMDPAYLQQLESQTDWLPGPEKIFSAFSLPLNQVNYLLLGESPYPRAASANGYAFWDQAVGNLWSSQGMDKKVNRATSLRNFIKMLFVADGLLQPTLCDQPAIATIDKSKLIQTNQELFTRLLGHGFLLLNTTLVLQSGEKNSQVRKDALAWQPFIRQVIYYLLDHRPEVQFILFGKIAQVIDKILPEREIRKISVEHPYNHTFITNPDVLQFFRPFHLLRNSS